MKRNLTVTKRMVSFFVVIMMLLNMAFVTSAARSLDADLTWTADFEGNSWNAVSGASIFSIEDFEPGDEEVRYFKVSNSGTLAFSYDFKLSADAQLGALADVIDVYYAIDVNKNITASEMNRIGTLNEVVNGNSIVSGKMLPSDLSGEGFEIGEKNIAVALKLQEDASGEYTGLSLENGFYISLVTQECEFSYPLVDKLKVKLPEADFLYRAGNQNTVALGSLFEALEGETIENASIEIEALNSNVTGVYTPNSTNWAKGTIQFAGTGPAKVVISADGAKPVELILEVVEAKNATTAASATANNVVLLNDISGTFTVSNGYTFYGNGFKVSLPSASVTNVGNGFTGYISIGASQDDGIANGGNLDNVKIIGPVYPEMYIYRDQAKITDTSDPDYGDGNNMRYFRNSVIVYGGNCTISNSYISGSRAAVCLRGGNNVTIENTTLSGGSYANLHICAGSKVTLRDLTTVQVDVPDSYGKGVNAHGLGIAVDSNVVDLYIEGELNQYNWLCKAQWDQIVPSTYQSQFPKFFTNSTFSKYWHYKDGDTSTPYVNIGMIFACNWDTSKIHDNRATVNYAATAAQIAGVSGGVYTKINTVGGNALTDAHIAGPVYVSEKFNPVAPTLDFNIEQDEDDASDAADTYCVYNETSGTLKLGISGSSKTIDFSNVKVLKNGTNLPYTKYLNGNEITGNTVTINSADGAKQTLTFKTTTNDCGFDKNGNPITGATEYSWTIGVEVATLSFPAPEWNMGGVYKFDKTNCYYVYYKTSQGYGEAVPIYEGIKIKYYDKSGTLKNINLSGTQAIPTGSANSNANAFTYTLDDGSILAMKYVSGWKSGATTHQFANYNSKTYVYPQSLDNDNYVRAKVANQDFDVKLTYTFTDPNGQSTSPQTIQWYNAMANNSSVATVQWQTFDSVNGKKSSGGCVTGDTLVTLSDGSQKRMDEVNYEDEFLVWNFETGEYDVVPAAVIRNHGFSASDVITLEFSDGTVTKAVDEHAYFDADVNDFVLISANTAENYIGHHFVKADGDSYTTVELVGCSVEEQYIEAYSILSAYHYNFITDGIFSLTSSVCGIEYFMPFEIGENMTIDAEKMEADIAEYGLFTYEDLSDRLTQEQFDVLNLPQIKVAVGKGIITLEEFDKIIDIEVLEKSYSSNDSYGDDIPYVPEETEPEDINYDDEIMPLSDDEVVTSETIKSGLNTVSTAKAECDVTLENISETTDGYVADSDEAKLSLTLKGVSKGYAVITVDNYDYYTATFENGQTKDIVIKNAEGEKITVAAYWGTHDKESVDEIDAGEFFLKELSATETGAQALIANTTKNDKENVNVFIAVYNKATGQLVKVNNQRVTIKSGDEFSISVETALPRRYELKVFLWDDNMCPVK